MQIEWTSKPSGHVCRIDGKLAAKVSTDGVMFYWASFRPDDVWAVDHGSADTLEDAKHAARASLASFTVFAE